MFSASESVNVVVVTPFEVLGTKDGGLNCCVPTLPIVFVAPVLNRFKPMSELTVRSTSANFTRSRIWGSPWGVITRSRLTGLPNGSEIATARSALVRSFTVRAKRPRHSRN